MKSCCISYGIARSKKRMEHRTKVEKSLQRAFTHLQNGELSADKVIERYKTELQNLDKEKIRGQHVRCRAEWLDKGEASSKYFASTEQRQGGRHHLVELEIADGTVLNTRDRLLQAVAKYYEDLYSEEAVTTEQERNILDSI